MPTFALTVSYGQVAIFDAELSQPFNDWRDEHVAQGFAWRPGSVSFRTLAEGGIAHVTVKRADVQQVRADAARALAVPFRVPDHGVLEVASIGHGQRIELKPGDYRVVFEHGTLNDQMWCELTFIPVTTPTNAEILRADGDLAPPERLSMEAEPA